MTQSRKNTGSFARDMIRRSSGDGALSFDMRGQLQRFATAIHIETLERQSARNLSGPCSATRAIRSCSELLALLRNLGAERNTIVTVDFFSYLLRKERVAERKFMKFADQNNRNKGLSI